MAKFHLGLSGRYRYQRRCARNEPTSSLTGSVLYPLRDSDLQGGVETDSSAIDTAAMHLSEVKQALRHLFRRLQGRPPQDRDNVDAAYGEVLLYLIRTAHRLGIDLGAIARKRMVRDGTHNVGALADVRPSTGPGAQTELRPLRILIVEDERIVAADLQETLNGLGYDAYAIASSGAKAIAIARKRRPDIALMDIRIDGPVDGIEVAAHLSQVFDTSIVFVTALASDATFQRAKYALPYAYLIKPVSGFALKATLELAVQRRHQPR